MLQLIIKTSKLPISVINKVHDNAKFEKLGRITQAAEEYGIKPVIKEKTPNNRNGEIDMDTVRDGIAR